MGPFIQNLSSLSALLRGLTKKNAGYQWSEEHQEAFEAIKAAISEHTTLAYFDTTQPMTLQVDASMKGLGASLLQGGKPVAFASKALTTAGSNYANIERELLAVVYGCERFHNYIFGHPITVESDHKPLSAIHVKYLLLRRAFAACCYGCNRMISPFSMHQAKMCPSLTPYHACHQKSIIPSPTLTYRFMK